MRVVLLILISSFSLFSLADDEKEFRKDMAKLLKIEFPDNFFRSEYRRCEKEFSINFKPLEYSNIVIIGGFSGEVHEDFLACLSEVRRYAPGELGKLMSMMQVKEREYIYKSSAELEYKIEVKISRGFRFDNCEESLNKNRPSYYFYHTKSFVVDRINKNICSKYKSYVEYLNEKSP